MLVFELLPKQELLVSCRDKPILYLGAGTMEYLLIDPESSSVCMLRKPEDGGFHRYSFVDTVILSSIEGFRFCLSRILATAEDQGLQELSLFYRFSRKYHSDQGPHMFYEDAASYLLPGEDYYTAEAFDRWMKVRRNMHAYREQMELLMGRIHYQEESPLDHLRLQGNLYFALKSFLRTSRLPYEILFAPSMLELKGEGILDSVVSPDLFAVAKGQTDLGTTCKRAPVLVMEIVSPSSAILDYNDKAQIYQFHHVREYWIINPWKKQLMIMDFGDEEAETRLISFSDRAESAVLEGFSVVIDDIQRD